MAATTLTQASEDEILKIFQVVASKTIKSVDSLVKSTQPKLNTLIAETIDAFKSSPQRVDRVMNNLIARMKDLGMSVDGLTKGMDKIPDGMQSLQDALRAKEQSRTKAEAQVQALRDKGIAAEVRGTKMSYAHIITKKEMIKLEKSWAQQEKQLIRENIKLDKRTILLDKETGIDRYNTQRKIVQERMKLIEKENKLVEQKKSAGTTSDIHGGGESPDLVDPRGILAPIVDTFMGIKDSITGPFLELGDMVKRGGVSFKNFGKAMLTPIKSLRAFGAALLVSLVPMLGWALLILAIIAILTIIIFKFHAIKDKLIEWWDIMAKTLNNWWEGVKDVGKNIQQWILNIPKMIGDALTDAVEFVGGIGTRIWNALGDALEDAKTLIVDGFNAMINGMIGMVNKWLPKKWEIPLVGKAGAAQAEQNKVTADESGNVSKVQMEAENKWYKPWTWGGDKKEAATMVAESGTTQPGKAVIVQDNKTINNAQNNAPVSNFSKADKNPEPSSLWDKITFWN